MRWVKFKYSGILIETVLYKLPTTKIISDENGSYIIYVEVFRDGIDMLLKSQGEYIELLIIKENEKYEKKCNKSCVQSIHK